MGPKDLSKRGQSPGLKGLNCSHCGETCDDSGLVVNSHPFCCQGCATIYELLQSGTAIIVPKKEKWAYLESQEIQEILLLFKDQDIARVKLELPGVHCSSCIQILEKLPHIHQGIISSRLLFSAKEISISFHPGKMDLRAVVELLDHVGYPPKITLNQQDSKSPPASSSLTIQIGVAGFVFGNVMLMSFPAYLGLDNLFFEKIFGYLSLALCIPLLYISASDYLKSAYAALINKTLNIDVSIAIGIITLFMKSTYDILTQSSPGYLDSLSGFILFLLIGKWIQQRTYQHLSFERKYDDYFPLHATLKTNNGHQYVPLSKVLPGDFIWVKHGELIPCDGLNVGNTATLDYSFVTGESRDIKVTSGDKLYAGGRNSGSQIEILVTKKIDQSYLTGLWEEDVFHEDKAIDRQGFIHTAGKYFTSIILTIAASTFVYWYFTDPSMVWATFTSVLIIACPCVLALSTPFTYGSMRSFLSGKKIFFRNTQALEMLTETNDVVFDKTGTLTSARNGTVEFIGEASASQLEMIRTLAMQSSHPLSQSLYAAISSNISFDTKDYEEVEGKGVSAYIKEHHIKLGSHLFVKLPTRHTTPSGSIVHVSIDEEYLGFFQIKQPLKPGLTSMLKSIGVMLKSHLLSGDHKSNADAFKDMNIFPVENIHFAQDPIQKLNYIKELQNSGSKTLMIGDGLNDAGAFRQSDLSIVVTEDLNNFTPSTDIIMDTNRLQLLPNLLEVSRKLRWVIYGMYFFAILYNGIGLYFAVQGLLTPIVAAILMPISSVSIVIFGTVCTYLIYRNNIKVKT